MRKSGFIYFVICILWLFALVATGQSRTRHTKNYHKNHYNKKLSPGKQCHRLNKKRSRRPRKKWRLFGSNSTPEPRAEYDPNDTPPPPPPKKEETPVVKKETPKEEPKKEPETPKLPPTKSPKHQEIRERVMKDLEGHEDDIYPIELDPLYFTFDESEFSVVDMEPFLVAVEYALQGRIVLIEGHTDRKGQDDYNVQLSIQRVERIRQLMLDMGVPDDRISVVGYGEEQAHEDLSDDSRQKDRRVDFKVF
ncbi:OmpA family protein [Fulvivirga maritima]|uniref:OmpA family protein n=1 Tax=Fulvivirga maritima TaxID=2904247 RepID=UPI001F42462E|nr:OmpA family protein [Fulvivirga maritima]UII24635.1 OmpA family protein [Fulvivirga maritima]